ncbi:MAG: HAD-IB family phosphatase [Candidatus Didemnitutus sp.]|nr:HAD-IB family phosphatase [Candidatus Didemnitutus sp.]
MRRLVRFGRLVSVTPAKLICFDCDSTLSAIEGVDELARFRGPDCFARVEEMTRDAMEGRIALDEVFGRRLELIRPTAAEMARVGAHYIAAVEPTARATIQQLRASGWRPVIVSGGYTPAIAPLAAFLGIERIEAVNVNFDAQGNYLGYDTGHPATRCGGKPEILQRLRHEFNPTRSVVVGDGVSDLETREVVDQFIGFGRYAERAKVKAGAHAFIRSLDDLLQLLK